MKHCLFVSQKCFVPCTPVCLSIQGDDYMKRHFILSQQHTLGTQRDTLRNNNNNNNNDRLTAFDPGQPGQAGTRRNIHPLTPIRINVLPLSPFSICNDPWHPLYSTYVLDSPHVQPLSRSSLVFLLVLNPQLLTLCISSPSHRHLFATHDRTLRK